MLTKAEIFAELKKIKSNYRQRSKKIRRKSVKWSEFIKKVQAGSFITCEQIKLEHQKRRLLIANSATRKICLCPRAENGDGIA